MGMDKLTSLVTSASKYLSKAVDAREQFYQGMEEAADTALATADRVPNFGPNDAKYRFGQSQRGKQLIADNRWNMAQSRTFALMAVAHGIFVLVQGQRQTHVLLKEVKDEIRRSRNS